MQQSTLLEQKISFWQVLFYLSLAVVTLWLILKLSGIIQTPVWLEFGVPIAGLIVGIFSLYHDIISAIQRLGDRISPLETRLSSVEKDINFLKK